MPTGMLQFQLSVVHKKKIKEKKKKKKKKKSDFQGGKKKQRCTNANNTDVSCKTFK